MRKLQIEDVEVMRIAIQQEIGRSEESRYDHRLRRSDGYRDRVCVAPCRAWRVCAVAIVGGPPESKISRCFTSESRSQFVGRSEQPFSG